MLRANECSAWRAQPGVRGWLVRGVGTTCVLEMTLVGCLRETAARGCMPRASHALDLGVFRIILTRHGEFLQTEGVSSRRLVGLYNTVKVSLSSSFPPVRL